MKKPFFNLTTKIVLMVTLMGMASALIALYNTWHMRSMEQRYHDLLHKQAKAAHDLGGIQEYVSQASMLVYKALTTQDEEEMLLTQSQLHRYRDAFERDLRSIYPLLPQHSLELDTARMQAQHTFAVAERALLATMRWRGDRALHILGSSFTPSLELLNAALSDLSRQADAAFEQASRQLTENTQRMVLRTAMVIALSLCLMSALAAWISLRHVSLPIQRLTRSMQHMHDEHAAPPIGDQDRHDEIGTMARALQSFRASLAHTQRLQQELTAHQHNQLLVEHLTEITSALPSPVFQMKWRSQQKIELEFVSPQWAMLMGLSHGIDLSPASAAQHIRAHAYQAVEQAYVHFSESAESLRPVDFEVPIDMPDGVTRWIKTRANPKQHPDGSVTFHGVWLDVSKEVMQSRALEKAKRQAEQVAQEKSNLQASISHEIRTPLNAILGLAQLMLKTPLQPEQHTQLTNIWRAGQHLRGIVNEVLDFSKIDAGQLQLESTDFSLRDVLHDVITMCQEDANTKGLVLHQHIAPEVPDALRGDPHRIAQILLNYVNNAIKFTPSGHVAIHISLHPSSNLHRIVLHASVQDTGPGIAAERIPHLFEAFQQADKSITRRFGGTGLGLTISRALAQLMGGSAGAHSQPGQGSTFWFTARLEPARSPVQSHVRHTQSAPPSPQWQGLRFLTVDDNALNRAVAEGMLRAAGVITDMAQDGAHALEILQTQGPRHYDGVLMDIQMPRMDGLSATRALRALPGFEQLPIIAMTAHTGVQDMEQAKAAGMTAYLSKPLLESALHDCLQRHFPRPHPATTAALPAPATPNTAAAAPETLADVFDPRCVEALAQILPPAKLAQLMQQFTTDTLERAHSLPAMAKQSDAEGLRAQAHKLTGTAATFGLLRLGQLSSQLTQAAKAEDFVQTLALAQAIAQCTDDGVAQLRSYCARTAPAPTETTTHASS